MGMTILFPFTRSHDLKDPGEDILRGAMNSINPGAVAASFSQPDPFFSAASHIFFQFEGSASAVLCPALKASLKDSVLNSLMFVMVL